MKHVFPTAADSDQKPVITRGFSISKAFGPLVSGYHSLPRSTIEVIASWPGHLDDNIDDFAQLVSTKSLAALVLGKLADLPTRNVAQHLSEESAAVVLDTVIDQADKATLVERQSDTYLELLDLGDGLVNKAKADRASVGQQLAELRATIPVKADPKVMELGKEVFTRESHCATCHQPHGQGLPNLYPPIDGSLWVTGSEDRLIRVVLDGLHGAIQVKGASWSSPPLPPMTGFRHLLNDRELAAVLTYVRNSWSNRATPVEVTRVTSARNEDRGDAAFWNAVDLLAKYPLEDGSQAVASSSAWVPKFVKAWKVDDFTDDFNNVAPGAGERSFENGELAFKRLGCAQCHRLGKEGGVFGPDLAKLDSQKRNEEYVLRSLLEPSKEVDDKFALHVFVLNTGSFISGLVVKETKDEVHVVSDPLISANRRSCSRRTSLNARRRRLRSCRTASRTGSPGRRSST
jgi:putative heme-binding domain-containing protein